MRIDQRFLTVFPIIVVGVIFAIALKGSITIVDEVRNCLAAGCFDPAVGNTLAPDINKFLVGTKFEGKLNTTEPPDNNFLNIYFATKPLTGRLSTLKCNCAYVGHLIIICDNAFLSSFSSAVNFTRDSFYGPESGELWDKTTGIFNQANARISRTLMSWMLGHEIGHAVLHSSINFDRRQSVTEKNEIEADSYFIEKIVASSDNQSRQNVYFSITQFIFSIVGVAFKSANDVTGSNGGEAIIAPSVDDIHPPWLIRALALGHRLAELDQGAGSDHFYTDLATRVVVQPGGTDVGSLCAFKSLREAATRRQMEDLRAHQPPKP